MKRVSISTQVEDKCIYKPVYTETITDISEDVSYYDPCDIHIHRWIEGYLRSVQNHKIPIYSRDLNNINGIYCTICHELFDKIILSSTSITAIDKIDSIVLNMEIDKSDKITRYDKINFKCGFIKTFIQ